MIDQIRMLECWMDSELRLREVLGQVHGARDVEHSDDGGGGQP